MNNRILLLFCVTANNQSASISTYSITEGTIIADAKILNQTVTQNWDVKLIKQINKI